MRRHVVSWCLVLALGLASVATAGPPAAPAGSREVELTVGKPAALPDGLKVLLTMGGTGQSASGPPAATWSLALTRDGNTEVAGFEESGGSVLWYLEGLAHGLRYTVEWLPGQEGRRAKLTLVPHPGRVLRDDEVMAVFSSWADAAEAEATRRKCPGTQGNVHRVAPGVLRYRRVVGGSTVCEALVGVYTNRVLFHGGSEPTPSRPRLHRVATLDATGTGKGCAGAAVSGDTIVVASPRLAALDVYQRSGEAWRCAARVPVPEVTDGTFGSSVAIDGDVAVVGAPGIPGARPSPGAFVFARGTDGSWALAAALSAPGKQQLGSEFGTRVALAGRTLAVSAPGMNWGGLATGGVFLFARDEAGAWSPAGGIEPPRQPGGSMGMVLAATEDLVLVRGPTRWEDERSSGADLYRRASGSPGVFRLDAHLLPGSPARRFEAYGVALTPDAVGVVATVTDTNRHVLRLFANDGKQWLPVPVKGGGPLPHLARGAAIGFFGGSGPERRLAVGAGNSLAVLEPGDGHWSVAETLRLDAAVCQLGGSGKLLTASLADGRVHVFSLDAGSDPVAAASCAPQAPDAGAQP